MLRHVLAVFLLTGCEELPFESTPSPSDGLIEAVGPCPGYRHEAMLESDDGSLWMGCGTDLGLFRVAADLSGFDALPAFDSYRVYDLEQDGAAVYVAGGASGGSSILERFVDPAAPETLLDYSGGAPFMRISNAHNIALASDGRRMLDSLTGNYVALDNGGWSESFYFNEGDLDDDPIGYQMMSLVAHDDRFYAVGSTISQPPMVFLPSDDPRSTVHFTDVALDLADNGSLEDLFVHGPDDLTVVGVDEQSNRAVLARCRGNCTDPTSYEPVDLDALVADNGRLHALHFAGDVGCAAGERFPQGAGGLALVTLDGGDTWEAVDAVTPLLSACRVLSDGRVVFGGDSSYLGVL